MAHPEEVSRRTFLRRAALAAAATAVASSGYGLGIVRRSAGIGLPPLLVAGRVNGLAAAGELLVSVGALPGGHPAVWTHRLGEDDWSRSGGSAFPLGTGLSDVTLLDGRFVAVGHTRRVAQIQELVDDDSGRRISLPIVASFPSIFCSEDGARWEQAAPGVPETTLGTFDSVAPIDGGRTLLALGSRFLEPGIHEGYGLISVASKDGSHWEPCPLPGVQEPQHGSPSLLARLRDSTLMATTDIRGSGVYLHSDRHWSPIAVPAPEVTYTAAGGDEDTFVLAGVEPTGATRSWRRHGHAWREYGLPGIPSGSRLTGLTDVGGTLVAAGVRYGNGFVVQVEADDV